MNTLTHEQAELLRKWRAKVRPALDVLHQLANDLAGACSHNDPPYEPETCPVCSLYVRAADAANEFHYVPDDLDTYLMNGPHPREATPVR